MLQIMLYTMSILSSLIFMQMNHPLAMGLMLLIQSFIVCLITGLMFNSFWYSYVLFLIFLGGLLILFIYVTSLASNEMFSFSMKIFLLSTTMLLLTALSSMVDSPLISGLMENDNMLSMMNEMNTMNTNSMSLVSLYNFPTNLVTILLMNYLLLTLIAVVKMTNLSQGPLRPMN